MTEIRIHRELNAPIGDVWRSLTDPDELASWFWPQRFGTECRVDLRVGGTYRIDGVAAGMAVSGEYVVVERADGGRSRTGLERLPRSSELGGAGLIP